MTVEAWCDWWLDAYKRKWFAKNTIQCANATVKTMVAEWGAIKLVDVEPEHIIVWRDRMVAEGYEPASVTRTRGRMKQIFDDAIFYKRLAVNPCSRHMSPRGGKKKMCCVES